MNSKLNNCDFYGGAIFKTQKSKPHQTKINNPVIKALRQQRFIILIIILKIKSDNNQTYTSNLGRICLILSDL